MIEKIKNTIIMKPLRYLYRRVRYGKCLQFSKPLYFLNNSTDSDTVCLILAGYKQFVWEIVFKRIKEFCPQNIDVCIVSSGLCSEELKRIAEKNAWSYVAMRRNCVTLALNSAIKLFPAANKIFKIDEDIFITDGFFEELPAAFEKAKKDYFPAFPAPLIPVNGYGYRRILEKLNLTEKYTEFFEYPRISAGTKMKIESDSDAAKSFWTEDGFVPQIDDLNRILKTENRKKTLGGGSIYPIRFSIGAIFFERKMLEKAGWFPVHKGICMGLDEVFLCNLATTDSKPICVSENQCAGHLSFGSQNQAMKEYFLSHKDIFDIRY